MSYPDQSLDIHARIDRDFAFHPATTVEKRNEHTSVREHCRELAHYIATHVPPGHDRDMAIDHLLSTMHWCNASIAKAG